MTQESILKHFVDWEYLAKRRKKLYVHRANHKIRHESWDKSRQDARLAEPPLETMRMIWEITDNTNVLTWADFSDKPSNNGFSEYGQGPFWIWSIRFMDASGNPDKIKQHWDLIAAQMPSLGQEQLVINSDWAEQFRITHTVLT